MCVLFCLIWDDGVVARWGRMGSMDDVLMGWWVLLLDGGEGVGIVLVGGVGCVCVCGGTAMVFLVGSYLRGLSDVVVKSLLV